MIKIPSPSLLSLESFFVYIDREYFTPHFGKLEHLTMFTDSGFKMIILAFYLAFVLAAFFIFYNRTVIGAFPRALCKNECHSPETAQTFSQLGFSKKNIFVKLALLRGNVLRRTVHCVEEEEWTKESTRVGGKSKFLEFILPEKRYKINFENDRFYIPEDRRYTAQLKFEKKGNGVLPLILTAVVGIIVVLLIFRFVPGFISWIDSQLFFEA
jgi:hypothetical protein